MYRTLATVCCLALLTACASTSHDEEIAAPAIAVDTPGSAPPEPTPLPERPIPESSVYPLILAEFAMRRGDYNTALDAYLEQARVLNDAGVASHATHLAQYLRRPAQSLEAVQIWLELEPDNVEANNTAATLLAGQQRPLEALPHMAVVARSDVQANFPLLLQGFNQIPPPQQAQLVAGLNELVQEFPLDPALLMTQALIHAEFQQFPESQAKLDTLFTVDPLQHQALLLEARIRLNQQEKKPFRHIEAVLQDNPEDTRLRLEYAKLLTNTDMAAARQQFEILSAQSPEDADLLLSLALINRENGDDLVARAYLNQMLALDARSDEAHYYLGRIAEDRDEQSDAVRHYQQVSDGRQYLAANQRLGQILIESGQFSQVMDWFNGQRTAVPDRSEQLYNIEADLLSSAGYLGASREVLNRGIAAFPDSTALRYARSMVGEQQNDLVQMEADLRAILAHDPNNATALNALGYTLTNRTNRHDEALTLISRALELDPEEPAILDSMGWVLFRKGRVEESLSYLTRAYAAFPDPEVAAHLGEVLWANGDKESATRVWQGALLKDPNHPVLLATLERLGVSTTLRTLPGTEVAPQQ
ncbi:tetratricopeptide repeat protein [Halioglobus maricola]|uniref:Tetratricopeptide repeat protein n=1 Tax=Halioglobus maricola TaxID=2601894 RepID=A0A5P9NGA2_9GAMM|nr:tetratricopeptide repeat protein [Halioglobus maricola]QFU74811.1 tetratricopeptide repeat protein [Halioglobus maricola]